MHTAGRQFFHVCGIKDQRKRSHWGVVAQRFFDLVHVNANARGAPHIVHGIFVLWIIFLQAVLDDVPKIVLVRQL